MIHFVVPQVHDRLIREYLELWGRDVASRFDVIHTETLPARRELRRGTYVLAALDQYSSGTAALVAAIHAQLATKQSGSRLRDPGRIHQPSGGLVE